MVVNRNITFVFITFIIDNKLWLVSTTTFGDRQMQIMN